MITRSIGARGDGGGGRRRPRRWLIVIDTTCAREVTALGANWLVSACAASSMSMVAL